MSLAKSAFVAPAPSVVSDAKSQRLGLVATANKANKDQNDLKAYNETINPPSYTRIVMLGNDAGFQDKLPLTSSFSDNINDPIVIKSGHKVYMTLLHAEIPNTLNNVSVKNRTITLSFTKVGFVQTFTSVTIPEGFYNGVDLAGAVQTALNGLTATTGAVFVVTYVNFSRRLRFECTIQAGQPGLSELTFLFTDHQATGKLLGFQQDTIYVNPAGLPLLDGAPARVLISTFLPQLYGDHSIYVRSSFKSNNVYTNYTDGASNIIARVPINVGFGQIIYYNGNIQDYRIELKTQNIQSIKIELTDRVGNLLDLQGANYELTFRFDVL